MLRVGWLLCALQWLLLAHLARPLPYGCKIQTPIMAPPRLHSVSPTQYNFHEKMIIGVKHGRMAVFELHAPESSVIYHVTLTSGEYLTVDRIVGESRSRMDDAATAKVERVSLLPTQMVYFSVIAVDSFIELSRADGTLLHRVRDDDFQKPVNISFGTWASWLHSCSVPEPSPPLGCRSLTVTSRYDFSLTHSIVDEQVDVGDVGDPAKAIRFLVRTSRDAYVRLKGIPSPVHYEIDLNFLTKLSIQRNAAYLNQTPCRECVTSQEFRLFTVVHNASRLELYEGSNPPTRRLMANMVNFKITGISFASMSSAGSVQWMHGCQGYNVSQPAPPAIRVPVEEEARREMALTPGMRAQALNSSDLVGCRMVHTYKYRFDSYFALSEEGFVLHGLSMLHFRVLGRKDIHLQLAGSFPPVADDLYEIDIDFYNHTNLERGKEPKVASRPHAAVLSPTELRGFMILHNLVSGLISISTENGTVLLEWRDTKPFPLRYFSIASGSSAGNDTTWVFGCPGRNVNMTAVDRDRVRTGCSRPLVTYTYSHSQYFSVSREGVVNGSQRTIHLYLRAKGSGHVRLENALPPGIDALFEVDLSHEGTSSIDTLGRRATSQTTPGLLSPTELRGFWIRQDMEARTLAVGRAGSTEPFLSWTAPSTAKFLEVQLFSLSTSRSVGNGTWYYGCKDGLKPDQEGLTDPIGVSVPEVDPSSSEDDWIEIPEENPLSSSESSESTDASWVTHLLHASRALFLHFLHANDLPPAVGTAISVGLNISKVFLSDMDGMAVIQGFATVMWQQDNAKWEPKDFDNIENVNNLEIGMTWKPEFTVPNGDLEMGGVVHTEYTGVVRWQASLDAQGNCLMQARSWPHDEHTCTIDIALLERSGYTLRLAGQHEYRSGQRQHWVEPRAAAPLWHLVSMNASVLPNNGHQVIRIVTTLRRTTPILHHLLLAPFVVLSALGLLAYWVREPLPRDKVVLGMGSLVLLVFSFLVLEAACPPGLVGIPSIVEMYCWCLFMVTLSVVLSALVTARSRSDPLRNPPTVICQVLSVPLVRRLLILYVPQANKRPTEDELQPDGVDYSKGSSRVYARFDKEHYGDCRCGSKTCSKQVAMEAQYYWTILAMSCERIMSLLSVVFLLVAAFLLH